MTGLLLTTIFLFIVLILLYFYTKYEIILKPHKFAYNKHGLYYERKKTDLISNHVYLTFWDSNKRKWIYLTCINETISYYMLEHKTHFKPKVVKKSYNNMKLEQNFIDSFKNIDDVNHYNRNVYTKYLSELKTWKDNKPK